MSEEINTEMLLVAATEWPGKAYSGLGTVDCDESITDALGVATRSLNAAKTAFRAGDFEAAIVSFHSARDTLERAQNYEWPGGHYYSAIYEGIAGSGTYETSWYQKANTTNCLTAIDELIQYCEAHAE